jgi:hypothetical protein
MEISYIFFAFFGVLGVIVFTIIGLAVYTAFFGKGKNMANTGVRMRNSAVDTAALRGRLDRGPGKR